MTKLVIELPISSHEPVSVTRKKNWRASESALSEPSGKGEEAYVYGEDLGENRADEEKREGRKSEVMIDGARDSREGDERNEQLEEEERALDEASESALFRSTMASVAHHRKRRKDRHESVHGFEVELPGRRNVSGDCVERRPLWTHRADAGDVTAAKETEM